MEEGEVGLGGGGGAGVARGRRGHGAREDGWGSAAGTVGLGQFPDRTVSETVATAQLYCDGTNKLRLQLKKTRPTAVKVAYATQDQWTTTERPFSPVRTPPLPRAAVPHANRADI